MDITSALVLVNMGLTLLYPIAKMIGRTKKSKCSSCCEIDIATPTDSPTDTTTEPTHSKPDAYKNSQASSYNGLPATK